MKIAFIGIGNVGFAIANNLQKTGHDILIGHSNPGSESVKAPLKRILRSAWLEFRML